MQPFARCFFSAAVLIAIGTGALAAQSIVPSPAQFTLNAPQGGVSDPATLTVTSSGTPLVVSVAVNTFGTGNWLFVSPNTQGTPATFIVSANALGLALGTYNGEVLLSAPGAASSPISVPITFTVGNTGSGSNLSVTPPSLSFTGQAGGLSPSPKTLAIATIPSGTGFAASAAVDTAFQWLQVSPITGNAPAALTVTAYSGGLSPGTYNGAVIVTPANGAAVRVPVTLSVYSGNVLSVSASSLQFYYQMGGFLPVSQYFDVSAAAGTSLGFAVTASTNDGKSWLSATPLMGNSPQSVTVAANPTGLGPGTYTGKVNISAPSAANTSIDIPVTLTIGNGTLLTSGSFPAPFVYQTGGAAPLPQSVPIGSTGGSPLQYSTSVTTSGGGNWLSVSPSTGTTPQALSISVNPNNVQPGTYSGTVVVTAPSALNSPLSIPITFTVSDSGSITASVQSVNLNYQIGGSNQVLSQSINVSAAGQSVTVFASAVTNTCGANWLRVYPETFTTPSVVTVSVEALGFTVPQNCSGVVVLSKALGGAGLQIPVSLRVANTPLFNINPLALNFSAPFDGSPTFEQNVQLSVTDNSSVPFEVTLSTTGGGWLHVSALNGTTPATLKVSADPSNLITGTYNGAIMISSPSLINTQAIPVVFKVTSNTTATVSPTALSFEQVVGGGAPAAKQLNLTATPGQTNFTLTTTRSNAVGWLTATPNIGTTPSTITVSVNGTGLNPGSYSGSVIISLPGAANNPVTVPISFNISPAQAISVTPSSLSFAYSAGTGIPAAQKLRLTSAGDAVNASAAATTLNGGSWLSVSPATARTPAEFTVSVDPSALSSGVYSGTITITAPGAPGSPLTVPVQLEITGPAAPVLTDVYNAASGQRGSIAPGEIVTLRGNAMGPAVGAGLRITPDDKLATQVEGTRILFENYAAPILYTSANQVNVVVPYEVAGMSTVRIVAENQGVRSTPLVYQVRATAPGIFTTTQTGRGQGAILNENGSYNGSGSAADRGSIVQVFGTGEGVTMPPSETASITRDRRIPVAAVRARVGAVEADVVFAGAAPDAVAGLLQVNVRIPFNAPVGDVPLVLIIGGVESQPAVTVAVK